MNTVQQEKINETVISEIVEVVKTHNIQRYAFLRDQVELWKLSSDKTTICFNSTNLMKRVRQAVARYAMQLPNGLAVTPEWINIAPVIIPQDFTDSVGIADFDMVYEWAIAVSTQEKEISTDFQETLEDWEQRQKEWACKLKAYKTDTLFLLNLEDSILAYDTLCTAPSFDALWRVIKPEFRELPAYQEYDAQDFCNKPSDEHQQQTQQQRYSIHTVCNMILEGIAYKSGCSLIDMLGYDHENSWLTETEQLILRAFRKYISDVETGFKHVDTDLVEPDKFEALCKAKGIV